MKNDDDNHVSDKLKRAEELLFSGELEESRELFEEVLNEDETNWKALNGLGLIFANIDTNMSIKYFEEAIENCEDSETPFLNLGSTHARLGQKHKAIEIWELGLEKTRSEEGLSRLFRALGLEYLYSLKDFNKARVYLNRVLEIEPTSDDIIYHVGVSHEQEGELVKAEKFYLKAPTNYNAVIRLALLYWNDNKVENSIKAFERALAIDDTHMVRFSLAAVYNDVRIHDREKALEHLMTGLEMFPYSGNAKDLLKKIIEEMPEDKATTYRKILLQIEALGKSPENAIPVDSVKEEYTIIKSDSCSKCDGFLEVDKQSLVSRDNINYDRLETHCRECKREETYWFLIDSFFGSDILQV
ncbi:MAG: tetratricopeptide repeat protein [Candidatus Hodarchaeales archaeon]|jgi:tetratricopeptide (TPR) repeat protein